MDDAVEGLHNTNAQVASAARSTACMAATRSSRRASALIAGYTPFIAWYAQRRRFLFDVLPRDHPVLTSVIASANQASEEWRKQHGLIDLVRREPHPGANPTSCRARSPARRHACAQPLHPVRRLRPGGRRGRRLGNSILPQFMGMVQNVKGEDWKGDKLKKNGSTQAENWLAAAVTLIENSVPLISQGATLAGIHMPNESEGTEHPSSLGARARKAYDPFMFTQSHVASGDGGGKLPSFTDGSFDVSKLPPLPPIR
jgi:hypothetical protein